MAASDREAPKAAHELLARAQALTAELTGAGFGLVRAGRVPPVPAAGPDPMAQFDLMVTDPDLGAATRTLYRDGHHVRAVEEGFKFLNNAVKGRSGETTRDGQSLMLHVFAEGAPVLRLNRLRSQSQKDEQAGYKFIFAGAMTGIRNPRAHEHDLRDEGAPALEMLVLANHLMRALRGSTRTRRRTSAGRLAGTQGP